MNHSNRVFSNNTYLICIEHYILRIYFKTQYKYNVSHDHFKTLRHKKFKPKSHCFIKIVKNYLSYNIKLILSLKLPPLYLAGERRLSYRALQGALMIYFYR